MKLAGKIALVTGGSRGIGRATALAFAAEGADIAFCHLDDEDKAGETAGEIRALGRRALHRSVDVADIAAGRAFAAEAAREFGPIDILFNNAGINKLEPIWEIKDETWDLVMNVCLRGTMWTMRAVIPHMIKQGKGAIVNMASAAGWIASSGGEAPYSAAKAGVMGLTRAAAGELAGKGIRVNAIAPSVIYNEFLERIYPKSMFEGAKKRNPMGRLGEPVEVANLALFLASDMSSYITGEVISISGGSIVVP